MSDIKATIFIPTYNGEPYLAEIIEQIFAQDVDFEFELLIIDSGSTDRTLEIIHSYEGAHKNLRLVEIPNEEFGHGKTRNLAAQLAAGEFIVYLSHDAVPSHDKWLYEMLKPFELNEKIVGVMGKQIPRRLCPPMLRYEISAVFSGFGPDFGTTLFYKDAFIKNQATRDAIRFYSDVNSATKTKFIREVIPYRDVKYAEDQMFGEDVIDAGYLKAYSPRGSVIHSNDLRVREYALRMFDEIMGMRRIGVPVEELAPHTSIRLLVRGMVGDSLRIMLDRGYSFKRKVYWLVVNPLFRIQKYRGIRRAIRADITVENAHHSLEATRKK